MLRSFELVIVACSVYSVFGYVSSRMGARTAPRVKPVSENFFLDFAEDPEKNTAKQIYGEANYKTFVKSYNPDALLIGGTRYNAIERIRALKLLTLTAESGLLEVLESKGLTLSTVEKLLPLADQYGVLPLLLANKDLLLNTIAPLVIEPAPALLPILVSVLKTPASTYSSAGAFLLVGGLAESFDNIFLGAPVLLLSLPLLALGAVLGGTVSLPTPTASSVTLTTPPPVRSDRPVAAKKTTTVNSAVPVVTVTAPVAVAPVVKAVAPVIKVAAPAAVASVVKAAAPKADGAPVQRVRKLVKVNSR